jgi:hypothetical protein
MNKTFFLSCLVVLCEVYSTHAEASLFRRAPPKSTPTPMLNKTELRSAAFIPANEKFRKIYGNPGLSLQLEGSRVFKDLQYLEIWENLEWIFMHGSARPHSCGKTHIDILDLSVGVKFIGPAVADRLYFYAGAGPDFGVVFVENQTHCFRTRIKEHKSYAAIGVVFKTGMQIVMKPHFYLNFFADYNYLPVGMQSTIDVGGLKVGGGFGGKF